MLTPDDEAAPRDVPLIYRVGTIIITEGHQPSNSSPIIKKRLQQAENTLRLPHCCFLLLEGWLLGCLCTAAPWRLAKPHDPLQNNTHTHCQTDQRHMVKDRPLLNPASISWLTHLFMSSHSFTPSIHSPISSSIHTILYSFMHPNIIHTFPFFMPPTHSCIFPFPHHLFTHLSFPLTHTIHPFIHSNTSLIHIIFSFTSFLIHFTFSFIHSNPSLIHTIHSFIPFCIHTIDLLIQSIKPFFVHTIHSFTLPLFTPSIHSSIHSNPSLIHIIHSFTPFLYSHYPFIHTIHLFAPSIPEISSVIPFLHSPHEPSSKQLWGAWRLLLFCTSLPWHHLPWPRWSNDQHDGNEILSGQPDGPSRRVPWQWSELLKWDSGNGGCFEGSTLLPSFPTRLKAANQDTPEQPDMVPW